MYGYFSMRLAAPAWMWDDVCPALPFHLSPRTHKDKQLSPAVLGKKAIPTPAHIQHICIYIHIQFATHIGSFTYLHPANI